MTEIRVLHKRQSPWPWIAALALVAVVLWGMSLAFSRAENAGRVERVVKVRPAAMAPKTPSLAVPERDKRPRPAAEDEVLRLRTRMMA